MIPNLLAEVEKCKAAHPDAWANAHTGNAQTDDFIKLLSAQCHAIDPRFGNNGKRGDPRDISDDALCFFGEGADFDPTRKHASVSVIDVIASAGTSSARPSWSVVTNPSAPVGAAFVEPGSAPPVPVPPATIPSYEALGGDEGAKKITRVLEHDYKAAQRPGLDGECGGWIRRTDYDVLSGKIATVEASIAVHRDEWLEALGLIVDTPPGLMSHGKQCLICGASVGYEKGKPKPIVHAPDCTTR